MDVMDAPETSTIILKHRYLNEKTQCVSVLQQYIWLTFSVFLEKVVSQIEYNEEIKHMLNVSLKIKHLWVYGFSVKRLYIKVVLVNKTNDL